MNEPTTLPEVIAYLTAKFTAGTNLSSGVERLAGAKPDSQRRHAESGAEPKRSDATEQRHMATLGQPSVDSGSSAPPAQNPLSQTQILNLLELGLANPSKQEDRR